MKRAGIALIIFISATILVLLKLSPLPAQTGPAQKDDSFSGQKYALARNGEKETNSPGPAASRPGRSQSSTKEVFEARQEGPFFLIAQKHAPANREPALVDDIAAGLTYPGRVLYIPGLKKSYLPEGGLIKPGLLKAALSSRYILGFYVDRENDHPSSYSQLAANAGSLSAIVPFWYRLSPADGTVIQEHHLNDRSYTESKEEVLEKARRENIEVLMLVHNLLYREKVSGKDLAAAMLATKESRGLFINQLDDLLKANNYQGVNLDLENIYLKDRDKYTLLIEELYHRLAPQGYKVTVCVPAKTGDSRSNAWSGPFDYQAVARYAHYVVIMTYDEHGYSTGPGPIASFEWVEDVISYALQEIPPEKILLGLPGYGFDWKVGQKYPGYISHAQAVATAASRETAVNWDNAGRVPYYSYRNDAGEDRQVWFENAASLSHKLDLVNEYNLGGIAVWRLGLEDPEMWNRLNNKMQAKKTGI